MARAPVWVALDVVLAIHDEQIAEHGGACGVRDLGRLEAALARPTHRAAYSKADLAARGASYACGIARNHPFVDGNKRTALVVAELFLALNGIALTASDAECVGMFLEMAAGDLTERRLAGWLRKNSTKIEE